MDGFAEYFVVLLVLLTIPIFLAAAVFILFLYRRYDSWAFRSLNSRFDGLDVHPVPAAGDVTITYHTYHGVLTWFTQVPHQVSLPPEQARELLGRLLRFNLSWGLLVLGGVMIPPLAIGNYIAQRRSISVQEAASKARL